jgi:hypothetical protein
MLPEQTQSMLRYLRLDLWRRAILGGQVLNAKQRLQAYGDLVATTQANEGSESYWWPLRKLSSWRRARTVRGNVHKQLRDRAAVRTLAQRHRRRVADALFPDVWLEAETVSLNPQKALELLVHDEPLVVPVRCRSLATWTSQPCAVAIQRPDGSTSVLELNEFGAPTLVKLDPDRTPYKIRAHGITSSITQARLPSSLAKELMPSEQTKMWRIHGEATVDLLAPTVLKIFALNPVPTQLGVSAQRYGSGQPARGTTLWIDGHQATEWPITEHGPVKITMTSAGPTDVLLWYRQPNAFSMEPPGDRRLVLAQPSFGESDDAGSFCPSGATELRQRVAIPRVPLTVVARTFAGKEDLTDDDGREPRWSFRHGVSLNTRLGDLWLKGGVRWYWRTANQHVVEARTGLLWRHRRESGTAGVALDLRLPTSLNLDSDLTTWHARLAADYRHRLSDVWRLRLGFRYLGRGVVTGEESAFLRSAEFPLLWSQFKANHPHTVSLLGRVRRRWSPNQTLGADLYITSNAARARQILDRGSLGLFTDFTTGGFWVRAKVAVERRFADTHRPRGIWNPQVMVNAWHVWWFSPRLAVQPSLVMRYQHGFRSLGVLFGATLYWDDGRGLDNLRPNSLGSRTAALWYHGSD